MLKEYAKYQEKHGQEITDSEAREEIVARACEDLFGRSEAIKQFLADFAEKNKEAAVGLTAAVKRVLARIKEFFENLMFGHSSRTLEAGIIRKCGTDVVDGLMAQYEKTFFAALEGNAARNALGEFEQGGVRFSLFSDIDNVQEARTESREIISILEANLHLVASEFKFELESDGVVPGKKSEFVNNVFVSQGGVANNKTLGRVELSNKGAKSTIFHGYGKNKLIATHAIKSVIENGDIISTSLNYKGKGKDRYIIAAKGLINQRESYLAVVVEGYPLNGGHKQFYLHEVLIKETAPHIMTATHKDADTVSGTVPTISISQNDEMSTPDAKKLLEDRVSGDDLLNAQDLIADVRELGGQVDEYGYITLYHRTSADKAAAIRSTGEMIAKEDGLFFSTKIDGQNVGYGDTVVTFSIPAEKLLLDDIFDDEAHLRFPLEKPGRVSMQEYLISEDTSDMVDTGLHSDPEDDVAERDAAYMAAVERGDTKAAQRMVDAAAKAAGYDKLFYHGAKKGGGFTVFRDWSYFTENRQYAERYTERGNEGSLYTTYVKLEKPFDTRQAADRRLFAEIRSMMFQRGARDEAHGIKMHPFRP